MFCNNCVSVCDSFVMYCVMVRGLCLCALSLRVRMLNMCVSFVLLLCGVVCGVLCVRCVCACFNVFACFVCGSLCDVVRFAFDACCFVFVCFAENV